MARQANILSFDEAKRDVRSQQRPLRAASRTSIPRVTERSYGVPEFESPFRQPAPSYRNDPALDSRSRAASSRRAPESRWDNNPYRDVMPAPARERTSAPRHAAPTDTGRASRRPSRYEELKKSRAKSKAERKFSKQFGGSKSAAEPQGGPRAAVYKGEMGAKHRQAARMQNAAMPQASAKRGRAFGSLTSLKSSPKFIASAAVAACLVLSCLFLYPTAQQYYQAVREHDRLAAEYAAIEERNNAIEGDVASLQTDSGVENKAHEQFGWVKEGEETANVRGLDLEDEESTFRANITPGSVEAPETWYSPFLDKLFGVE